MAACLHIITCKNAKLPNYGQILNIGDIGGTAEILYDDAHEGTIEYSRIQKEENMLKNCLEIISENNLVRNITSTSCSVSVCSGCDPTDPSDPNPHPIE